MLYLKGWSVVIFKHVKFERWAKSEQLTNEALKEAVFEIVAGLHNGDLGAGLYKKRISKPGHGKSGSYRTLIAFRLNERAFFIHGFSKNQKDNIDSKEKEVYKKLAHILLNLDENTLANMIEMGSLIEVR